MRPTRLGLGCLLMAALALMAAGATGNNLLYLLYSVLLSALAVSVVAGRVNLANLAARVEAGAQVFRGDESRLDVVLTNEGRWPAYAIGLAGPGAELGTLAAGAEERFELRLRLPHRGLNRLEGLALQSAFPFGLILHRKALSKASVLALPRPREVRSAAEVASDVRAAGRPVARKGTGDELYAIRAYDPSDESRTINWKLTAKTGRPLVNEFCAFQDEKVTVRLEGVGAGEGAERRVEDAAGACRFYVDSGAEVRLVTPEGEVDYGKGLPHLDKLLQKLALLGEGKSPRPAPLPGRTAAYEVRDSEALRDLTLLGAALVYGAVFLVDEVNARMLAAAAPVFPLAWLLRRRGGPRPPQWVWNLFSLGVLAFILSAGWRVLGVTVANVYLLLYLLVNRVLSEVKAEELPQTFLIFFLAFFLVSGLTISLWYFLFFLLYLALSGAWLMLAAGLPAEGRRWAGALSGLLAITIALAAVSFAATPRVEGLRRINPFLAAGIDKLSVKTSSVMGFTENVTLGFFGELKKSSSRVMRVAPLIARGGSRGTRPSALLIRGSAFDSFDGRRWSKARAAFRYRRGARLYASAAGFGWALHRGRELAFPASPGGPSAPAYDFVIYPMGISVLFTVGTPWLVEGIDDSASFDGDDAVHVATPYLGGLHYKLYPSPYSTSLALPLAGREGEFRERFLQLPRGLSPRVLELARRVTADSLDDAAKARAVESHLRRNYSYSTFSEARNRSLEDFLFSAKRGNCEYFATAGVVLLRASGVPARLATGFLADDWNEYGRFYDVRQEAAHAWVEAYAGGRWLTLDPTPPGGFSSSAEALGLRLERLFDAAQAEWFRRVIGYDQYVQHNTFRRLGLALSPETLLGWARRAAKPLLALGALAWALLGLGRLRGLLGARPKDAYLRAEAALKRAGLAREPHWTPREYARAVLDRRPELGELLGPLAELHYLGRYGPGLEAGEEAEAKRLFERFRERI